MGRQKDVFWNYVEIQDNGGLSCKFCKKEFSGGSSRIKSHLSGIKGRDVTTCPEVPGDVQEAALHAIGTPQKRSREETAATASTMLSGLHQSASSDLFRRMDMIEVNEKLIKHLILNNVPLDIIKEPSLLSLLLDVAKLGSRYEPPSYSTLVTESLPSFEKEVKRYARTVQKSWGMTGCSLIMNSKGMQSTSPGKCNFVFTAYSPKGMIFLEVPVEHGQMTNVRNLVMEILDHDSLYNSDVVQIIICDLPLLGEEIVHVNVNDITNNLVEKCPWISKTKCVQCEIQLLLRELCCASEWLSDLVEEANSLYSYVRRSHFNEAWCKSLSKARPEQHSTGIHANCFSQLQLVLELEPELRSQLKRNGLLDETILNTVERNDFWNQGKEVLHAVSPLLRIPYLLESLVPTLGFFYEAMEKAGVRIKSHSDSNPKFVEIRRLFEERMSSILYPIHAAAAYLNPAFATSEHFMENHEIEQGKTYMLEKLVREEDKQAFEEQLHLYANKDPLLFDGMSTSMLRQYHPVVWWDMFGNNVPVLRKYATRLLSQPCTSLSSYHCKSQLQRPDNYLLRKNTMMMEEFNRLGEHVFQFIDLDELD